MERMSAAHPFNPRLVLGLIAAGLAAFAALLLLLAFGTNAGSGRDGRAHALSVSAVGFKGLVDLVGQFRGTHVIRGPADFGSPTVAVVAVELGSRPADLARLLEARLGLPTLIILPKWRTLPDPSRRGWVRGLVPGAGEAAAQLLGREARVRIARAKQSGPARGVDDLAGIVVPVPAFPQVIDGADFTPAMRLPGGEALVARLGDQPHYVVADPDLFNNHGLRNPETARAALAMIDALNPAGAETVDFDLTVNGLGARTTPNLLRNAFEPPFLVMTLALLAAALLAGLHGAVRFGRAKRETRAIAFGKAALVENSAGLIRLAGREARLGSAYGEVVRLEAARTASAPAWLSGAALDAYLDKLSRSDRPGFSTLAAQLAAARDRHELVAAARALFSWKKDIIR
jgi:hypothetical protein